MYGNVEEMLHPFPITVLDGGECAASCSVSFISCTHRTRPLSQSRHSAVHDDRPANQLTTWRQNPKVHHCIHNILPRDPTLNQLNPLCPSANLREIHSDSILPSTSRSYEWSLSFELSHQNLVHFSILSHASYMPCSSFSLT
jgi:hypothetical protein